MLSPFQPTAGLRTFPACVGLVCLRFFQWRFTMSTTSNEKSYFDLHTSGSGYIQRAREVPVRGGRRAQPFLACTIAALVGSAKDPSNRYFDVKVAVAEAKKEDRKRDVEGKRENVVVEVRVGSFFKKKN